MPTIKESNDDVQIHLQVERETKSQWITIELFENKSSYLFDMRTLYEVRKGCDTTSDKTYVR